MDGKALRAWREGLEMSQAKLAEVSGISRKTVLRAEAATGATIPKAIADFVESYKANDAAAPTPRMKPKAPPKPPAPVPPALAAAMKRNPPFATTGAEAKAMRALRAEQRGDYVAQIRLLPLRPEWRRLESGRQVNAAIPDPLDVAPPAWSEPRGVLTASGRVYDFEAAHVMQTPDLLSVRGASDGEW